MNELLLSEAEVRSSPWSEERECLPGEATATSTWSDPITDCPHDLALAFVAPNRDASDCNTVAEIDRELRSTGAPAIACKLANPLLGEFERVGLGNRDGEANNLRVIQRGNE